VHSEVFLKFIFQSLRVSFVTLRLAMWLDDEGYIGPKLQQAIRQCIGYLHKLRTSKKILIFTVDY